jgi:enterochelin esterase family protein
MNLTTTLAFTVLSGVLHAQAPRPFYSAEALSSPRMTALSKAITGADRAVTITAFWDEVRKTGTPLVEPVANDPQFSWVTFLWQAKENTINVAIIDGVASGIGGSDPAKALMTHLARSDVWYRTYKVRNDAVFHYWLSPNDCLENLATTEPRNCKPQPDPLNPRRLGPVSYLELSGSSGGALSIASPSHPSGKVERTKLHSAILNNDRDLWVYTPNAFQPTGSRYPLLVVFDGSPFADWVGVPTILDNLIAQKRIPPMVAALVAPVKRAEELACDKPFTEFLAAELVPWIREHYHATDDPANTIVAGSSLGGLAAAFAGFQHPEVFGNVLSQSGSYWWSPQEAERSWLTRQLSKAPLRPLKISMSVGLMEIGDQLDTNRHLRDVLIAKGYPVSYSEFNGNHSYVAWRADFAGRLVALVGHE